MTQRISFCKDTTDTINHTWDNWVTEHPVSISDYPTCYVAKFFNGKNVFIPQDSKEPWNLLSHSNHSWTQWWGIDDETGYLDIVLFDDNHVAGTHITIAPATPLEVMEFCKRTSQDKGLMSAAWKEGKKNMNDNEIRRASFLLEAVGM